MNTQTLVEVYLGNPITVASEQQFLARLRHDLQARGVSARIFGNLHFGERQIDWVVITDYRVAQIEQKTFAGPVVSGPKNGPWRVQVGSVQVRERDNPYEQALGETYALSDTLAWFARSGAAPAASKGKFYFDIDTLICAFPELPDGSNVERSSKVTVIGYGELIDRLTTPGPRVPWTPGHWDAFCRRHHLYQAEEDTAEGLLRRAGEEAADAYLGRFLQARSGGPPLVATSVTLGAGPAARPDLAATLTGGRGVLLHGASGLGKTLWASRTAVELAQAGHVPVWLTAVGFEESFELSAARAIAPFTSRTVAELLKAAAVAGRAVVFFLDDLSKLPESDRDALLAGILTLRVADVAPGLLITAQDSDVAGPLPECLTVELTVPGEHDRLAILEAYGTPEIIGACDAFRTPFDLSLAAAAAGELEPGASRAALIDHHVDKVTGGDERLRAALRSLAGRLHETLKPSLPKPELSRALRRGHALDDEHLQALWDCQVVAVTNGRVSFSHDRFEQFLAAEAMLLSSADAAALGRELNRPRCAPLREDVIALEADERRLEEMLGACEHADVIVAACSGRLGQRVARVADRLLVGEFDAACDRTAAGGFAFHVDDAQMSHGHWDVADPASRAAAARLTAAGRMLRAGAYVEHAARLLDLTDGLCAQVDAASGRRITGMLFGNTYVLHGARHELPGSIVAHAAADPISGLHADRELAAGAAAALLAVRGHQGRGALFVAGSLLRFTAPTPLMADVIVACVKTRVYHLLLLGLELAEESGGRGFDDVSRQRVVDAVSDVPTDHLFISTAVVEALSALGEVEPARDRSAIEAELAIILADPADPTLRQMAYGAVAAQFEDAVIGPYHETISDLRDGDRDLLMAMALDGSDTDGIATAWIVNEIENLDNPALRSAVVSYVARTDPQAWFHRQSGMRGLVGALELLGAAGEPIPDPAEGGSADPAWRTCLTALSGVLADAGGREVDGPNVQAAWGKLCGKHRDVLASLLANLRGIVGWDAEGEVAVHELVLAALPPAGVDVLVWSLRHPDELRSLPRHDHHVRPYLVDILGRVGDHRAAEALRELADDPELGETAIVGVRAIEARAVS